MTNQNQLTAAGRSTKADREIPADVEALLGLPPILRNEDVATYKQLRSRVAEAVAPTDFIEWLWLRDVVDLSWEIQRLRRFKALLIDLKIEARVAPPQGGDGLLRSAQPPLHYGLGTYIDPPEDREEKARERQEKQREEQAKRREALLDHYRKLAATEIGAAGLFLESLGRYEQLDKLIDSAESRRNAVLRDIEKRRESLASRLRKAANEIIDGQFSEAASEQGQTEPCLVPGTHSPGGNGCLVAPDT